MGRVKSFITDHGFYPLSDIYVCSRCLEEYGLKEYISENAEYDECSYCGKWSKKKKIAIHINDFISYFLECLDSEWGNPVDEGVGWESREGGWISAKVIDSYDLINDELELDINHDELKDLLIQTLFDREWCQKDPHGLLLDSDLLFSWQRFSRQVKHKSRYVFFRTKTYREYSPESDVVREPHEIMEHLDSIIKDLGLIGTLPENTKIFRARASTKRERFKTVEDLGPPEEDYARFSNRMSPAGISMFYGALEKNTAFEEVIDTNRSEPAIISLATFTTLDEVKILDLTHVPPTPSIFDEEMRDRRLLLSFLNGFLRDFIKPIIKDGREHIEYVPTQVVTEYFRHVFVDEDEKPIQGILYPSSRRKKGICCVFFFDQSNCTEAPQNNPAWRKHWLLLAKNKTVFKKIGYQNK
jgi:DNA-directed RNA polymerase subunit RPC12/RpoP